MYVVNVDKIKHKIIVPKHIGEKMELELQVPVLSHNFDKSGNILNYVFGDTEMVREALEKLNYKIEKLE